MGVILKIAECDPLEKLVLKSSCDKTTCRSTAVYTYQVPNISSNISCITKKRVKEMKCCCPPPESEHFCEASSGILRTVVRKFKLKNGRCIPIIHMTAAPPVICSRNESTAVKTLKSGKIRFLHRRTIREGCECRNITETAHSSWSKFAFGFVRILNGF